MELSTAIGKTLFATPSDVEVLTGRTFEAPRHLVFDAWTRPEHVRNWLLGPEGWTMPICEIDLRPGGAWRFVWRHPDGRELEIRGEYRDVSPPARLVSTEKWIGTDFPESLNTLILTEHEGRTTVTQTVHYASQQVRDAALATGMNEGVAHSFDRLDNYLQTLITPY